MEDVAPFSWNMELTDVDLTPLGSQFASGFGNIEFTVRDQLIALNGTIVNEEALKVSLVRDAQFWELKPRNDGYGCHLHLSHNPDAGSGEVLFVKGFQWDVLYLSRQPITNQK
jgi:hypothetical protein